MNQRPLPCVLAGFVLGEVWMWQFHGTAALAALICAAIMFIIVGVIGKGSLFVSVCEDKSNCNRQYHILRKNRQLNNRSYKNSRRFIFLCIGLGILLGGFRQNQWNAEKEALTSRKQGEEWEIQGQIDEIIQKEYSFSLVIQNIFIDGEKYGGKLMIYLDEELQCTIGSRILVEGQIEDFDLPTNPGGFNLREYREGRGILGVVYDAQVEEIRYGSFLIKDGIYAVREKCTEYLTYHMDEAMSGIGIAMALGEKGELTENQKQKYELAGISHVLAVSGLHMSLLGAGIYKIFRKMGFGYPVSVISSFPCIIMYAILTGMSSSCLRAAIMLLIYLIAEYKGYYYDLPSGLSFAGLWLLMEIPARLFDSGFLLSFGAMVSVGIVSPFLFHLFEYEKGKRKIRDSFLAGFLITLFTLPLSLYFFYGISLIGIFLNLLVIPLMTGLVPLLFIGSLGWVPVIPRFLSFLCLKPAELILKFYDFLCGLADKISLSYFQAGFRGLGFAVSYYAFLCICIVILYCMRKKRKFLIAGLVSSMLVLLLAMIHVTGRNDSYMTVLDVGQGDGILYHSSNGEVCMIDGGSSSEKNLGRYVIRPALEYYGIAEVDYWFVSHLDSDHISGLEELLEAGYPIKNIILPVREEKSEKQLEMESLAMKNGTNLYYMKQGDKLRLHEDVFYCIYPKKTQMTEDENQNSLVLLLETAHEQIMLTGDVEKEGEQNMTQYLKRLDIKQEKTQILKTAHHGSANGTGETFLNVFKPDTAIISCGLDNSYGHPAEETVERLKNCGSVIFYTMNQGAIEVRLGSNTRYFQYGN